MTACPAYRGGHLRGLLVGIRHCRGELLLDGVDERGDDDRLLQHVDDAEPLELLNVGEARVHGKNDHRGRR